MRALLIMRLGQPAYTGTIPGDLGQRVALPVRINGKDCPTPPFILARPEASLEKRNSKCPILLLKVASQEMEHKTCAFHC